LLFIAGLLLVRRVLGHMDDGMMGSLLVVEGGQFAFALPRGEPCHDEDGEAEPPGPFPYYCSQHGGPAGAGCPARSR